MVTIKQNSNFNVNRYEMEAWQQNRIVYGIDEVGRGCLAGPVVTAAVELKPNVRHPLLKDSKLLTEEERQKVYKWLLKNSYAAVSFTHHRIIDSINIYHATLKSMKRAVNQLLTIRQNVPLYILVDAMPLQIENPDLTIIHFIKGEKRSKSIAAASIIAKVTRDALLKRTDYFIPGYSFHTNKGYSTKLHKQKIRELGPSIIHRESFLNFLNSSMQKDAPFGAHPTIYSNAQTHTSEDKDALRKISNEQYSDDNL